MKPSEIFEGERSSLHQAYVQATSINQEIKNQAHKEFDEKFLGMATDFFIVKQGFINSSEGQLKYIDVRNFLDSLIDRTVQLSEERIVGVIEKRKDEMIEKTGVFRYDGIYDDIISLITKKSDINNPN